MPEEVAYDESDPKLAIPRLREIVRRLRAPDGCPWDIEQTHESLIPNLLEEAYEAADAIRSGDRAHMREELGDLMLQAVMHAQIADEAGAKISHVKPHGALYNDAAKDPDLADAIVAAVVDSCPDAAIVGLPRGALRDAVLGRGMTYVAEGFVDRAYAADGSLVARSEPNAVHSDLNTVTTQALRLATAGEVTAESGEVISVPAQTICLHGDTANAAELGRAVRDVLQQSGVQISAVT